MRRSTRSLCSFRLLLTVPQMAGSTAPPTYLGNDHLPSKRPCLSYYPRSHQRWRSKGMVTGAARSDVPHLSPGGQIRAPVLTANPRRKESNQGSWAPNAGIMVPSLGKPHIYSMMCSHKSSPAVVYQITPGQGGFDEGLITHYVFLWHLDKLFLPVITRPRGCIYACNKPVFLLYLQAWT